MPRALQTISGFVTFAGAATTAVTPAPGDTFNVPSFPLTAKAYIEDVWASGTTFDFVRIRSPRMHDANQGLRLQSTSSVRRSLVPPGFNQVIYPSDTPTVEIDGTAAGSDVVCITYGFDDLPGVAPRLATWQAVRSRIVQVSAVEVSVTSGAIGAWGASAAINSSFDNFEAGADYAWLGYTMSTACAGIALTGKDTGNLKIGAPGSVDGVQSPDYFITLDMMSGRPSIPIIAANNKGSTVLQNVDIAAATVSKVSLILAQLG